ncbi:hypothetical protein [Paucilactobacillus nenjiangensis]|jgi:hypothetical protein|uniref:Uncharacterized protein n=1 Tax=Paucilactobacillus nenjiangensis TaxID=1296540 RepID=A0A5P1X2G1_9LACO|nr:hypothetical protein [Paucilactobacillus nenjiangensis]QER67595.1 hypothetical protein F0161_06805 [Paucilactobacillus nenjiangensis]
MTLHVFEVNRQGFNSKIVVGELLNYENEVYIITYIGNVDIMRGLNGGIKADIVAQKINSLNSSNFYYRKVPLVMRYDIRKLTDFIPDVKIKRAGNLIGYDNGMVEVITGIENSNYDGTDLVIEYESEILQELPKREIDRAIKENRNSKFKVISGGK